VALPGGFGTLDEVFETCTLIQTGKIANFPLFLMGVDYWAPLIAFMQERLLIEGAIAPIDLELLRVTDDVDEVVSTIRRVGLEQFGLTYGPSLERRWFEPRPFLRAGID